MVGGQIAALLNWRPVIGTFERQHICRKFINPFPIDLKVHLPRIVVRIAKPSLQGAIIQPSRIGYGLERWRVRVW